MPSRIYDCNCNRSEDKMCRTNSCVHSAAEEAAAADESLLIYCKPVELYNVLHRRALENPSFIQRCLRYKIQARQRRRMQMTVSLLSSTREGVQPQNIFPFYTLLAKPVVDTSVTGNIAVYHLIRACMLDCFTEIGGKTQADANLILPDTNKLSLDVKAGKLSILLVSCGGTENLTCQGNAGRYCLWGKIPMESLCTSLERRPNLMLGHRTEMLFDVDMRSSFVQPCDFQEGSTVTFQTRLNCETMVSSQQVEVNVTAKVIGSPEKSAYNLFSWRDVPTTALSDMIQLRAGNVVFNYRDCNNMLQKTEVTEDFSCPFCLVKCACFKGLRYHLTTSHDLFNFEFWVTEDYQAVNVSVKIDIFRSQTVADGADPRLLTFFFCSKSRKRRRPKDPVQNSKHVYPLYFESVSPKRIKEGGNARKSFPNNKELQNGKKEDNNDPCNFTTTNTLELVASSFNTLGIPASMPVSSVDPECVPSISGSHPTGLTVPPCAKSRKLLLDRSDSRNRLLLQKRQFFHSHRAQPMALDEVLSDKDSEDEADHDIADFEDRRMLDDFVDVSTDEKRLMHLWNSFVRRQKVLADGHVPWACEAFSKVHGQDLVRAPALFWCWRLFMIKLWNHGLLDAGTINKCHTILEEYRAQM